MVFYFDSRKTLKRGFLTGFYILDTAGTLSALRLDLNTPVFTAVGFNTCVCVSVCVCVCVGEGLCSGQLVGPGGQSADWSM